MIFFRKKKQAKVLGGRKRSPGIKTDSIGLSKATKKKIEEQMLRKFIKDAREKGGL